MRNNAKLKIYLGSKSSNNTFIIPLVLCITCNEIIATGVFAVFAINAINGNKWGQSNNKWGQINEITDVTQPLNIATQQKPVDLL